LAVLARYDSSGLFMSSAALKGNASGDAMAMDSSGNLYVGERKIDGAAAPQLWISKYSPQLTLISSQAVSRFDVGNVTRMASDGTFIYTINDGGSVSNSAKLIKYDGNLTPLATAEYSINGLQTNGDAIALDGSGNAFVMVSTGHAPGAAQLLLKYGPSFDGAAPSASLDIAGLGLAQEAGDLAVMGSNLFYLHPDPAGSHLYLRKFDTNLGYTGVSSTMTDVGSPLAAGLLKPGLDGNLYLVTTDTYSVTGGGQILAAKFDQDLNGLGVARRSDSGPSGGNDLGLGLAVDGADNVVAVGMTFNGSNDDVAIARMSVMSIVGQTKIWSAPAGGNASVGSNWTPAGAPQSGDYVVFDADSNYCDWDLNVTLASVTFTGAFNGRVDFNAAITVNGPFELFNGTASFTGHPAMTHIFNGPVTLAGSAADFRIQQTTVVFAGSVTANAGWLEVGNAALVKAGVIRMNSGSAFTLWENGAYGPATVTSTGTDTGSWLDLGLYGQIDISTGIFKRLSPAGLQIGSMASLVSLSSFAFSGPLLSGATAVNFVDPASYFVSTFTNVNFMAPEIGININAQNLAANARITVRGPKGPRSGPPFENDPSSVVWWPDAGGAGGIDEGWESGPGLAESPLPWSTGGAAHWFVDAANAASGVRSVRSGAAGDNQTSYLEISLNILTPGYVGFKFKTDTEASFDFLRFKINGSQRDAVSGSNVWTSTSFYVGTTGQTFFRWEYGKDSSGSVGEDAVWVDEIQFPPYNLAGSEIPSEISDDFERSDSCAVGNNWMKTDGQNLCVDNHRLRFFMSSPNAGLITQKVDQGPAFGFKADLGPGSNLGYGCHYSHWLMRRADGSVAAGNIPKAHALRIYRYDCNQQQPGDYPQTINYSASKVEAYDNGSFYDHQFSSFQFTGTLRVAATFYADGSIRGRVLELETGRPYEFMFASKTVASPGDNVGLGLSDMDSGTPWATIDSVTVSGLGALNNPYFGAGGAGIFPPGFFSEVSSTSFRAAWNSTYAGGTQYQVQASPDPAFGGGIKSASPYLPYAVLTGLSSDTTYFVRVSTLGADNGPWFELGQVRTLKAVDVDFENGIFDMSQLPWALGGTMPWLVQVGTAHTGLYAAQSGASYANQSSFMELTVNVLSPGNISFFRKVSSEENYDWLRFYIDAALQEQWSGELGWGQASYPAGSGMHTFRWEYSKDVSVDKYSDAAFVDNISLPAYSTASSQGLLTGNFQSVQGAIFDGGKEDRGYAVAVDTTNYFVYSVGQSSRPGSGADYLIVKYNFGGIAVASAAFEASVSPPVDPDDERPWAAAVDPRNGDLYVAGSFFDSAKAGGLLVKFGSNLVFKTSATFSGSIRAEAQSVALDAAGNVFVSGNVDNGGGEVFKVGKYSENLAWQADGTFPAAADSYASGLAVDGSGNVYVAGADAGSSGYLFKFANNLGAWVSSATMALGPKNNDERLIRVAVNPAGTSVYAAGDWYNGADKDFWVGRFSPALGLISTSTYNRGLGDIALDVAVATNGAVYVTGASTGSDRDVMTLRYGANLNLEGSQVFDSGKADSAWGLRAWGGYVFVAGFSGMNMGEDMRTLRQSLAGSEGPSITAYIQGMNLAPATASASVYQMPMLRLGLWSENGNSSWYGQKVYLQGDVPASQVMVSLSSSASPAYDPGSDKMLYYGSVQAGAVPYAQLYFQNQLITASTRYFFLSVSYANAPVGAGLQVGAASPADFYMSGGEVSPSGAPWQSGLARIQFDFWANPFSNPAMQYYATPSSLPVVSGGYYTGLHINGGQQLRVEASGLWTDGTNGWFDPDGNPSGAGGRLVPGSYRGALVGRVGAGGWFGLGKNSTATVTQSGDLYLAMNDDNFSDNASSIAVRYYVLASTMAKVWAGGYPGFETKADFSSNWINGKPFNGDRVVFDDSSYDCDWDIPNLSLRLLEMTTSYARTVRLINSGAANSLTVTDGAVLERGTLDLGYNNQLAVPGTLLVKSSATLNLGAGQTRLQVGTLRLTGNSLLSGYSYTDYGRSTIENAPGVALAQFLVEFATVDLQGYGPTLANVGALDISAGARINAFDRVRVTGSAPNPNPTVRFHAGSPIQRTLTGWEFDASVSTNVDGSDVAPGSNIVFSYSSGPRMGSPFEADPKGVIAWSPDGGGSGSISGQISGGFPGTYWIFATTDPAGGIAEMSVVMSSGSGSSPQNYILTGLRAPATYYIFGFRSADSWPSAASPRGGYGYAGGSWLSLPRFLAPGAALTGTDLALASWVSVSGQISRNTAQLGPVLVQAWRDGALQASTAAGSGYFQMTVPSAVGYEFRAFVDVNGNAALDYFEASASSSPVDATFAHSLDFNGAAGQGPAISGGSAGLGGTISVATATAHSGSIAANTDQALLKLALSAANLDATLHAIAVRYDGDISPGGVGIGVFTDDNANGVFDGNAQDMSRASAWLFIGGPSSATLQFWDAQTIAAGTSKTFFLTVSNYNTGRSRLVIESTGSFALTAGDMADQKFYPVDSGWAQVKRVAQANMEAFPYNSGGNWTGFTVYQGQALDISAQGVWYSSAGASGSGPGGIPGTEGQNTVLPSAKIGELIARVNSYDAMDQGSGDRNWFAVGVGTTGHIVRNSGDLILAMNDYVGAYYDNAGGIFVDYSVAGATTGAVGGTVYYTGAWTGTVDVVANLKNYSALIPQAAVTFALRANTTYYPYVIPGLRPGEGYVITAQASTNTVVFGRSAEDRLSVVLGSTVTADVTLSLGSCTVSGVISYGGVLRQGLYRIVVTTRPDFENPIFVGEAATQAAGAFTIHDLPIPNTFYFGSFLDGNYNGMPDGPEPLGYYGSTNPRRGLSDWALAMTPVYVPVASSAVSGISFDLVDNGAISGNVSLPQGAQGKVVVSGLRGAAKESQAQVWLPMYSPGSMYYSVGLLRPATHYALFAFLDRNSNGSQDPGEESYYSGSGLSVPSGGEAKHDFALQSATAPPAATGFFGAGRAGGVAFSWNPVPGATQYRLVTATAGIAAVLAHPASGYLDALPDNTSSQIRAVAAANFDGASTSAFVAPVYSLAVTPADLSTAAVYTSSVTLSWSAANPPGTQYVLYRSTDPAKYGVPALSTAAAPASDRGLAAAATYFWRLVAINGNGIQTGYGGQVSTVTKATAGPSIAGELSYAGAQRGGIIVQAFGNSAFVGTASATAVMPNTSLQPYFLSLVGNATYFLRAFVDYNGDGVRQSSEAAGSFNAAVVPHPIRILAGPATGYNFAIAADTVAPAIPAGLRASPGLRQVSLSWGGVIRSADGSPLTDLQGYMVQRTTVTGVNPLWSDLFALPISTTIYVDQVPLDGVQNFYRVLALDIGDNRSLPSGSVAAVASLGGAVSGAVSVYCNQASGQFRVRLSTMPSPNAPFLYESLVTSFSFTGLPDNSTGYFLRAFLDKNNDGANDFLAEPSGAFGGLNSAYPISVFNGSAVPGVNVTLCDRTRIFVSSTLAASLAANDCPALDKGPGYYADLYAFPVGDGSAGSLGLGSQIRLKMWGAAYDTELILLSPDGRVIGRDNRPGGAVLLSTVTQSGVYVLEATSFNPGQTGPYDISLDVSGGFAGVISGSAAYSGAQAGPVKIQLFNSADASASPIQIVNIPGFASPSYFQFSGLADGYYYVRAFRDGNANMVQDPGEPVGAFGASVSSPTAVIITGGVSNQPQGLSVTMTDPAVGAVKGVIFYDGSQPGAMRIDVGQCAPGQPSCDVMRDLAVAGVTSTGAANAYLLNFLPPATNYFLRAYVDSNANKQPDIMEAKTSSGPIGIVANSTVTLGLILRDPGSGAAGAGTLRGIVDYPGVKTGAIMVGFSRSPSFTFMDYTINMVATGTYIKPGVVGGATYYMAGFMDVNGNGNPDDASGEPVGVGAPEGFGGAVGFDNPAAIFVPLSGATTANLTFADPPTGEVRGRVTYGGAAPADKPLVVQIWRPNSSGPNNSRKVYIPRQAGVSEYNYALQFLAAGGNYSASAVVDSNGNDRTDYGEPYGQYGYCGGFGPCYGTAISVSSGPGTYPTYGVDFTVNDPGSFGGGTNGGVIRGDVTYMGTLAGPIVVRFFDNPGYEGLPLYTTAFHNLPVGPAEIMFRKDLLAFGTYYLDAYRGDGDYNPTYHGYGRLNGGNPITVSPSHPENWSEYGSVSDPGAGGSLNVFTGSFAASGGARFDGGATDFSAAVVADVVTGGGPYLYVEGISKQFNGTHALVARYGPTGVMLSSVTVAESDDAELPVVDDAGRLYQGGRLRDGNDGPSTGTITQYGAGLNLIRSVQFPQLLDARTLAWRSPDLYAAAMSPGWDDKALMVLKIDPDTFVVSSTGTVPFARMDIGVQALGVDASGNVYVFAAVNNLDKPNMGFLLKFDSSLNLVGSPKDVTSLDLPRPWGTAMAVGPSGEVYLAGSPSGKSYAVTYKFDSNLVYQASATYSPIVKHFSGGIGNIGVDGAGYVYEAWEAPVNGGDFAILRYDPNLALVSTRTFDGLDNTKEDFPFSLAVKDVNNVFVTGGVNNGQNLDWATIKVDMGTTGSISGAGAVVVITTQTAARAIWGGLSYNGTLVTSGTVRAVLLGPDPGNPANEIPIRFSTAPFGASRQYLFNNLQPATYRIQAFIDLNGNLMPEAGEPVAYSTATGVYFSTYTIPHMNLTLCDRRQIVVNQTLADALAASDCPAPDHDGSPQRLYTFWGVRGQPVTIGMEAVGFYDSYLMLYGPDGRLLTNDDQSGGNGNARITNFVLPQDGLYTVAASAWGMTTGSFRLSLKGSDATLGSVSGTIEYLGNQGGQIVVALFSSVNFSSVSYVTSQVLTSTRNFTFASLPTGTTYYMGSFVDVNSNLQPDAGEDGGNYGASEANNWQSLPISLQSGQNVYGANITIHPQMVANQAYVTGNIAYSGARFGPVRVELWPSADFKGRPAAVRELPNGPGPYDAAVPGGMSFFLRAYMDLNGNFQPDAEEPKGVYSPSNQGAEPLYAAANAQLVNIDMVIKDPWASQGGLGASGEGSAAILPSTVAAGTQVFFATITYTAGSNGIHGGGRAGFVVPSGFSWPQWAGVTAQVVNPPSTAVISAVSFAGQSAYVSLNAGEWLKPGEQIKFVYGPAWVPCMTSSATFSVVSAQFAFIPLQPLFEGAANQSLTVVPGPAAFIQPVNPYITLKSGELSSAQALEARDFCGNRAPVATAAAAMLRAKRFSQTTFNFNEYDDTVGFSTSANLALSTDVAVNFAVGQSSRAFFVLANSTGFRNFELFFNLAGPSTYYYGFTVLPQNALTGVSVATFPAAAGGNSVTITPNNDGAADQAYLSFRLGESNQGWHVLVSSVPFKDGVWPAPIWERWGWGQPAMGEVAWDGRYSPWISGGVRVPSGLYYVRVEVGGSGGVHDDRASVRVSVPQVAGRFHDLGNGQPPYAPLAQARIQVYGPNGSMFTQTDGNGDYFLPGVSAGVYNVFVSRDDFLDGNLSVTVDASGAVSTFTALSSAATGYINANSGIDVLMRRAPVLYVAPRISSAAFGVSFSSQTEQWGNIMVKSSTMAAFQQTLFSPMRLPAGTTTFDDGGRWDAALSSFVVRTTIKFNVAVGTYSVEAQFLGFDRSTASVYVGWDGIRVALPEFTRKSRISGTVALSANAEGRFVSVNAVPAATGTALTGGFGGVYLPQGVLTGNYSIFNLDAGTYAVRANASGYSALSSTVAVPASSDVVVNFPALPAGAQISGQVFVGPATTGRSLALYVNAWAPGSMNFGSTVVFRAGGGGGLAIPYVLKGLDAGTTYQLYCNLSGVEDMKLDALEDLPIKALAGSTTDFHYVANTGVIAGTITLPSGSTDFASLILFGETVASVRPTRVGEKFSVDVVTDPVDGLGDFTCVSNGAPPDNDGYCPANVATFTVTGLNTETFDITFLYRTNGQTRKQRLAVVNGRTTNAEIDLRDPTYAIAGSINNRITNTRFNTNPKIVANAPYGKPPGWPAELSSSTARVLAIRQDIAQFNVAISTIFDAAATRVGFLTEGGSFTISNVPSGVYYVRTENLRACATCEVDVPAAGAVVRVANNVSGVNLDLSDGYSVAGSISLDGGIRDARVLQVAVRNRRQEVVRSSTVYLGDASSGLMANSVDYTFSNLPANEFYTLSVNGTQYPIKYVGPPIKFPDPSLSPNGLAANLSNQNVLMKRAAYLVGRLKDTNTGELINSANAALLAPSFRISAMANPWVEGGYAQSPLSTATLNRPIAEDSYFRVGPLLPDIAYDLRLAQTSWDAGALMQGSQNYAPVVMSGLVAQGGEIKDVGVVALSQGQSITGVVRSTTTGSPLGGLKLRSKPSFGFIEMNVETMTNGQGRYTLWVSTAVSNQFDVTVAPRDGNLASDGMRYGEVTARNVIVSTTPVDFALRPLLASVTGHVAVADAAGGGELAYPFGTNRGYPAAALNLQPQGVVPNENPLGDIEAMTDAQGYFEVPGLSTGTYDLRAASLGYMVYKATVTTDASGFRIYAGSNTPANYVPGNMIVLTRGATVSGRIIKSDGSAPNETEVGGVAAANFAQNEFVMGSVDVDAVAKTVNSYSISGFKTGVSYDLLILPKEKGDSVNGPVEGMGVSFSVAEATSTKNINLTYVSSALDCVPASKKSLGNNQFQVKIECNKSLRKQIPADDDLDQILTLASGAGQLLGGDKELASNRRRVTVVYRASAGEANFSLRIRAYSQDVNPRTGTNFHVDKVFPFYVGLDSNSTKKVSNIQGGSVELEPTVDDEALGFSERAKVDLPPGTFADDSGVIVASNTVEVGLSKGRDENLAKNLALRALGYVPGTLDVLRNLAAYPPEMAAAIAAYRVQSSSAGTIQGANPLSSFYNIFLPAGIRHQLRQRADLTLSYSTVGSPLAAANAEAINVWYFDAALGRYVKEDNNRRVDPVNKTITVSVDHFSTFVVLDSTPIARIQNFVHTNEILAVNFPNPSDCSWHANVARNTAFGAGQVFNFRGTMIRMTLPEPSGVVSDAKVNIYDTAGNLVRTMNPGPLEGGFTHYLPWDCSNNSGHTVSSGVYFGEVVWGGKRRLFKMAIIKGSGL